MTSSCSSVTLEREGVVLLPGGVHRGAQLGVCVPLPVQPPVVAPSRSEAAQLPVLHHRRHDPVHPRVLAHRRVRGVHHDHLEVLVGRVLVHPVRVQNTEPPELPSCPLLRNGAQIALELELRDTLVHGLSIHLTLRYRALAATTSHSNPVDDKPLQQPSITRATLRRESPSAIGFGGLTCVHRN